MDLIFEELYEQETKCIAKESIIKYDENDGHKELEIYTEGFVRWLKESLMDKKQIIKIIGVELTEEHTTEEHRKRILTKLLDMYSAKRERK